MTADDGTVTRAYAYTPYGAMAGSTGTFDNRFTYGGKFGVMDTGSGLLLMWQRFYDSNAMRFISRDPIAGRLYPMPSIPISTLPATP